MPSSALWAIATTDASNGSVNSMHDSYTPLGGFIPLFNLQTDEVIFGGVGSGLYGMLLYAIVGVFIAGLMVGRTPEYLGKKIEQKEVKMAMMAIIATAFSILVFTAITAVIPLAKNGYWNPAGPPIANLDNAGPHGFSELLYAFSSASENNGSAFAGINVNTPWYNLMLGLAMLIGRFGFILAGTRRCGQPGSEEEGARHRRHAPHARHALCRPVGGSGGGGWRLDVLSGALAGPHRRALHDARGEALFFADFFSLELIHGNRQRRHLHRPTINGLARTEKAGPRTPSVRSGTHGARLQSSPSSS